MKYWWTLGCFPTGLQTPFRLQEFLASYQQQHVPIEVEEWLQFVLRDPVEDLCAAARTLCNLFEEFPYPEECIGYEPAHCAAVPFTAALEKFESLLGVTIGASAARNTLRYPDLREDVLANLEDYGTLLRENGSTPHRRAARQALEEREPDDPISSHVERLPMQPSFAPALTSELANIVSPPRSTAPDENIIIHLLTTFADGSLRKGSCMDARSTLYSAFPFACDEEAQSKLHTNVAISSIACGDYEEAEFHAKEAILACPQTRESKKNYLLFAGSVAYQDDFSRAESIIDDALSIFENDRELKQWKEQLISAATVKNRTFLRKSSLLAVKDANLLSANGKSFDNEFCWITFKNKLYPYKMDPTTIEMGSVFRRVNDYGHCINTSRSTERL